MDPESSLSRSPAIGRRLRDVGATGLVPALLCAVALHQFWTSTYWSLSPWKGGGFGMFSTIDSPGDRRLSLLGRDLDGRWYRLQNPATRVPRLRWLGGPFLARTLSYPNDESLERIGRALLQVRFQNAVPERLPALLAGEPNSRLFGAAGQNLGLLEAVMPTPAGQPSGDVTELVRVVVRVTTFTLSADSNIVGLKVLREATASAESSQVPGAVRGER